MAGGSRSHLNTAEAYGEGTNEGTAARACVSVAAGRSMFTRLQRGERTQVKEGCIYMAHVSSLCRQNMSQLLHGMA